MERLSVNRRVGYTTGIGAGARPLYRPQVQRIRGGSHACGNVSQRYGLQLFSCPSILLLHTSSRCSLQVALGCHNGSNRPTRESNWPWSHCCSHSICSRLSTVPAKEDPRSFLGQVFQHLAVPQSLWSDSHRDTTEASRAAWRHCPSWT
jgi:hypothetical protein